MHSFYLALRQSSWMQSSTGHRYCRATIFLSPRVHCCRWYLDLRGISFSSIRRSLSFYASGFRVRSSQSDFFMKSTEIGTFTLLSSHGIAPAQQLPRKPSPSRIWLSAFVAGFLLMAPRVEPRRAQLGQATRQRSQHSQPVPPRRHHWSAVFLALEHSA